MAVLKRTHIFLNTATSLYVRPAGEKPCPVLRHPLGDKTDYLHRDSRSVYDYHRKGGTDLPDDFETKLQWESNWFSKAMSGDTAGLQYRATIVRSRGLFMDPPAAVPAREALSPDALGATVARNLNSQANTAPAMQANTAPAIIKQEPRLHPVKREASHDLQGVLSKKAKELNGQVLDLVTPPSSPATSPVKIKTEPSSVFSRALSSTSTAAMGIFDISSPSPSKSTSTKKPENELDALEQDLETLVEKHFDELEGRDEMDCAN